jgi:hypothetical protein
MARLRIINSNGLGLYAGVPMRCATQCNAVSATARRPVLPTLRVLWQDAAVNHEKNKSARSERRRPSCRLRHDRLPPIATSLAVSVCGSCVGSKPTIRLFVEYQCRGRQSQQPACSGGLTVRLVRRLRHAALGFWERLAAALTKRRHGSQVQIGGQAK